ncbi:LAETG motif-containing sortase-dependent surface protein [Streptomyces sp. NPDC058486]|uniref:LAETG motif-containing sortase-dependent surface protein n=1 Tax=unclassified Streptomyces TaxID=2593676 RepID=UPI00365758F3
MKIRRILATAVAAAVTTPVVFLSAGTAVADTPKPTQKQTAGTAEHDEDGPSIEELEAAVKDAQAKVDKLKGELAELQKAIDENKVDEALAAELTAATTAVETAQTALTTAEADLATAQDNLDKLPAEATEEELAEAEAAVTTAEEAVATATDAKTVADARLTDARQAIVDAAEERSQERERLSEDIEDAEEELQTAKDDLEYWKNVMEGCNEDDALGLSLTGPEEIAAGGSGIFSLTLTNLSGRDLDDVQGMPGVALFEGLGEDGQPSDPEDSEIKDNVTLEWSSADVLEWTKVSDDFAAVEFGAIDKGDKSEVKLRVTVDGDAHETAGVVNVDAMYWNKDGSCGISDKVVDAWFDVTGTDKGEPTPSEKPTSGTQTPTPEPSPSTSTPAPAATSSSNASAQGGSSRTAVSGELAATGSNDAMPRLAAAAAAAVLLGAGALFLARRRKANA